MSASDLLDGLIPEVLKEQIARQPAGPPRFAFERFPAATLMADVIGFTELAEQFTAGDGNGVERLARLVNSCFGGMVDVIAAHGGDVIRFAGDAPIAIFRPDPNRQSTGESRAETVARAAACALELQKTVHAPVADDRKVLTRIGVGFGDVSAIVAGGVDGRWEFLVGGSPLTQMAEAQRTALPGEAVLSPEAREAGGHLIDGTKTVHGRLRVRRLTRPSRPVRTRRDWMVDHTAIRLFLPSPAARFLEAGQSAWAAELRRVSVVFLGIEGIDLDAGNGAERAHSALRLVQAVLSEHDGSLVQFLHDDKGLTLLAVLGLPGATHEDDAARAAQCAVAAHTVLVSAGFTARAGIATGRAFCGWRGNERRREYALIGTVVNRAARLMTGTTGQILCDLATVRAAGASCCFESLGEISLKGSAQATAVFRPVKRGQRDHAVDTLSTARTRSAPLIGRRVEREVLARALAELMSGSGSTVLIRGVAGIGKSTLLSDFIGQARAAGATIAIGSGESTATRQPYLGWQTILNSILEIDLHRSDGDRAAALMSRLSGRPGFDEQYAPLVAQVLDISMPDNATTSQIAEHMRAEKARDVVTSVLNTAAAAHPLVVVLDDVHWLDSLSMGLALAAHLQVSPLLLVLAMRPLDMTPSPEFVELTTSPLTRSIDLGRLDPVEVHALICQRLNVTHVPDLLKTVVEEKASGYPLFVGELVSSMHESGVLRTEGSACTLAGADVSDQLRELPASVDGAIAARIDRLGAGEQLTMKVASVTGHGFNRRMLAAIHPLKPTLTEVGEMLLALEERGFVKGQPAPDWYSFEHAVIQEVAYSMMPAEQRCTLHRAVAEWHERDAPADPPSALIAHHWTRADDHLRSLQWLERAGIDAARKGAVVETSRHFRQALSIADQSGAPVIDKLRRVRWLRYVGYANMELGAVPDGVEMLRTALHLLGRRLPRSRAGLGLHLGKEALVQGALLSGILPASARMSPRDREALLEQAEIARLLGKAAFFEQDHLTYLAASLLAINLAERTGARATAGSAYAALAYMTAMFGLERLAERWWRLADESCECDARLNVLAGRMLFLNAHARWEESARCVDAQAALIDRVGSSTSLPLHRIIRFYLHYHKGELDAARASANAHFDWAVSQNNLQEMFSSHVHLIMAHLEQGRLQEATGHIADASALAPRVGVSIYLIMFIGLRLQAKRLAGDLDGAREDAHALSTLLRQTSSYVGGEMCGYVALTEHCIQEWRLAGPARDRRIARQNAGTAFRALTRHALLNPYARPRRWLLHGKIAAVKKRPVRALRSWRRALELSKQYGMHSEEAYARVELGHHSLESASARRAHLLAARELFARMGSSRVDQIDESLGRLDADAGGNLSSRIP